MYNAKIINKADHKHAAQGILAFSEARPNEPR